MKVEPVSIGIAIFLVLAIWWFVNRPAIKDGFEYAGNPCEAYKTCETCADQGGCGWCVDRKECHPMSLDGFPPRDDKQYHLCDPFKFRIYKQQCSLPD